MDQEKLMFYKEPRIKSYTMTDLYLNQIISFGYEDSHNYYDIDVDNILLLRISDDEYFVRYNDVNKNKIVLLQLKIDNCFFGELDIFAYVDDGGVTADVDIGSNDEESLIKCREIWNKIIESIGINDPKDCVKIDDYSEFIMLDIEKKYNCY